MRLLTTGRTNDESTVGAERGLDPEQVQSAVMVGAQLLGHDGAHRPGERARHARHVAQRWSGDHLVADDRRHGVAGEPEEGDALSASR